MSVVGIDLGTTNSLVGIGDNLLTNLVSSNVNTDEWKQVGRDVVAENIESSYKTNMSMSISGRVPIKCSTVILRHLVDAASKRLNEEVKDVVISVPAYFSTSQREAVMLAAKDAGLNVRCLINEPTAAAIYVCRDVKDLIVVYDLGGGTFDISIVDSRMGNYSVIATDGNDKGGDDLDTAIVTRVFTDCKVPIRKRNELNERILKNEARLKKEELQKTRGTVYIDLSCIGVDMEYALTVDVYKDLVKKTFRDTIIRTSYLVNTNIPAGEHPKIVFVGGSTNCPYLREMVLEEVRVHDEIMQEVRADVNPDLIVAKGAALYADMVNKGTAKDFVEDVTKRLCIEDRMGNSLTIIEANSIVPCSNSIIVENSTSDERLKLKLYQGDQLVARDNAYIGELCFEYGRFVERECGSVEVTVNVSFDGIVTLKAKELLFDESTAQEIQLTAR